MSDTLKLGEFHPAALIAYSYVGKNLTFMMREAIASTALSGNRLAEVACGTIRRIDNKEPVSDRYLMGLAWLIYSIKELEASIEEWVC